MSVIEPFQEVVLDVPQPRVSRSRHSYFPGLYAALFTVQSRNIQAELVVEIVVDGVYFVPSLYGIE